MADNSKGKNTNRNSNQNKIDEIDLKLQKATENVKIEALKDTDNSVNDEDKFFEEASLNLYFGDDYIIDDKITIHQPKVGDFIEYGEKAVYSVIAPFVSNTTTYRVQLWDLGFDWNKVKDFELFAMLIQGLKLEKSKIIFGDLDFQSFKLKQRIKDDTTELVLYSEKENYLLTEDTYKKMSKYIQYMFNSVPEVEYAKGKRIKIDIINNERAKQAKRAKEGFKSSLLAMVSFYVNHPGSKYNKEEVRNVGIVEFMDSIKRLQIYESTNALMKGMYSGFVDTSKINKNEFNFMRDVSVNA